MDENINQQTPQEEVYQEPSSSFPVKKIASFAAGLIVIVVILLLVIFVVVPRISPKKEEKVTLQYWTAFEDKAPLVAAAAEFTRLNPNIKVEVEKQDIKSLGKYIDRLDTRMKNGTGPDIFRYHNSWITELNSLALLLPLPEEVIRVTELDKKFYPTVERDLKVKGAYYGAPIHFDTLSLFVNTELFKQAGISTYPTTWEDLYPLAISLTVPEGPGKIKTSGMAIGTFDNVSHAPDIMSLLLLQNGAKLTDLAGSGTSATQAFDFYTSFVKQTVWNDSMENSTLAFAKGNVAMYLGYSWDIFQIKAINPDLQFAVLPAPYVTGGKNLTVASYWVEGVSSKSRYPAQSFEFLKFLASRSTMESLYSQESKTRLFGELYPRSDMAELLEENTLIAPFVAQGKNAVSTIFSANTYDDAMIDSLNSYLGDAIRSINNDNTSSETAVETLSAGVAQIFGRYAGQ